MAGGRLSLDEQMKNVIEFAVAAPAPRRLSF